MGLVCDHPAYTARLQLAQYETRVDSPVRHHAYRTRSAPGSYCPFYNDSADHYGHQQWRLDSSAAEAPDGRLWNGRHTMGDDTGCDPAHGFPWYCRGGDPCFR